MFQDHFDELPDIIDDDNQQTYISFSSFDKS